MADTVSTIDPIGNAHEEQRTKKGHYTGTGKDVRWFQWEQDPWEAER
jgi:hypothetical protein